MKIAAKKTEMLKKYDDFYCTKISSKKSPAVEAGQYPGERST
jgi:hypothetical protein